MRKFTAASMMTSLLTAVMLSVAQADQAAKTPSPPPPAASDADYGDMAAPCLPVHTLDPIF
jgi:hypothetical protein